MTSHASYDPELTTATEAALSAGSVLRDEFNRQGGPRGTSHHAELDQIAEELILRRIDRTFPEDGFFGEELGRARICSSGEERYWVVDPNDGTSAFMSGFRGAAVSIALLEKSKPVLGVVYAYNFPDDNGDLIAWTKGGPVLRNGRMVVRTWPDEPSSNCTVLLSHHADHNAEANARLVYPMRYRAMPSIAYRLALVAAGEGDAAVSLNSPEFWDLAGGHAILMGAGGDLYDERGRPVRYSADLSFSFSFRVFGGCKALVDHLEKQDWSEVFNRPETRSPYSLTWPKSSGESPDAGLLSRAQGCLLGQLAGDALGSLVEFKRPEWIKVRYPKGLRELADGGTFNTIAGQPTDDSEMAPLLARTLITQVTYDAEEARKAYVFWLHSGPFDCGMTVAGGLRGLPNPDSQANGALMRVSPLGIFGTNFDLSQVWEWAWRDAALTHPHLVCLQANGLFTVAIAHTIRTGSKPKEVYNFVLDRARDTDVDDSLMDAITRAASDPPPGYVHKQGWVLIAFWNALWQLLHAPNFEEGVVDTVMRGGDTDTNAAICGALLGAVYGREAVPARWTDRILACRPIEGLPDVHQPRPECFWPVDALILAEKLLTKRDRDGRCTTRPRQ